MTLPMLLLVSLAVFVLLHLVPGDSAKLMPSDALADARARMGLHAPLPMQFALWLGRVAVAATALIAVPAGLYAAWRRDAPADPAVVAISTRLLSIPSVWRGLLLLWLFGLQLGWVPGIGYVLFGVDSWRASSRSRCCGLAPPPLPAQWACRNAACCCAMPCQTSSCQPGRCSASSWPTGSAASRQWRRCLQPRPAARRYHLRARLPDGAGLHAAQPIGRRHGTGGQPVVLMRDGRIMQEGAAAEIVLRSVRRCADVATRLNRARATLLHQDELVRARQTQAVCLAGMMDQELTMPLQQVN